MKKITLFLSLFLCLCLLSACIGTPVIYHDNCDCPPADGGNESMPDDGLKTGLAIVSSMRESTSAAGETEGEGKYDVTLAAVLVDKDGVIRACLLDGVAATVNFTSAGQITTNTEKLLQTKNELGDAYGMVTFGGARYEWYVQAKALADFAVGKTIKDLREGAVDESGKAPAGSDLASSATIYLGGYVTAIEKAVTNATYLGAQVGDRLHMASDCRISGSQHASAAGDGATKLEVTTTALSTKDGVITSCVLDAVQAEVKFDATGSITSNIQTTPATKNELGSAYGMVNWGGAIAEWDAQAAAYAAYVTGKTPAEVAEIAVDESTKPTEADLASSVTIAIGGFEALILKAVG